MKVRMKVQISGTRDGQEWAARGEEVDLPDNEAEQMVSAGLAEAVDSGAKADPVVEEAIAPEAERSTPTSRKPSARSK